MNYGDNAVLDCNRPQKETYNLFFRGENKIAIAALKRGKLARVDKLPAKFIHAGGEKALRTGEWHLLCI